MLSDTDTATVTATAPADPDRVWALLATPACWPAWAPQMRHVSDPDAVDGSPGTIRVGQRLRISTVVPGLAVEVRITKVDAPTSWEMEASLPVGSVRSGHTVTAGPDGTTVAVTLRWRGPRLAAPAVLLGYRPVAAFAVRRLLSLAGAETLGAEVSRRRMCGRDPSG